MNYYCCKQWEDLLDRDEYFYGDKEGYIWGAFSWSGPYRVHRCPFCGMDYDSEEFKSKHRESVARFHAANAL
jgi:hypothetical protein